MKQIKVDDLNRINPLSLQPGGSVIRVLFSDGKDLVYDKIKKPQAYINSILSKKNVSNIWLDGKIVWPYN